MDFKEKKKENKRYAKEGQLKMGRKYGRCGKSSILPQERLGT